MSRTRALRSRRFNATRIIGGAGLLLSACVVHSIRPGAPPRIVTLRGTVFDSLTMSPLRGARVTLTAVDTVTATTDTNGVFDVSLRSGIWRAAIAHPRFDSLRVAVPVRRLDVPPKALVAATLGTPSRRTVTRTLCGDSTWTDDVALVGIVRDAETHRGIDSAIVVAKWINLTLRRGTFVRSTDPAALPFGGPIDLEPDSSGNLFPIARGSARYRVVVRDASGRPISNARVRILGRSAVRTNDAGAVTVDSIAGGTQTLEILAIGYQPQRRTVEIAPSLVPTDTVVLASMGTMLDTVRVTASRDPSGFERRRSAGAGQFITAADVERENPEKTTRLLRSRDGLRLMYDRKGYAYIEETTQTRPCTPLLFVDGFPAPPVPMIPGEAAMDWLIHPDEIGGVEIYTNSAKIPPELARWGPACGIVVFWTRQALGLPKSTALRP